MTVAAHMYGDPPLLGSAGLLRDGAVAWVEVLVPDTVTTQEGVTFRPNLLATTSFDGSIATTFKRIVTDTVCDNTRALVLADPVASPGLASIDEVDLHGARRGSRGRPAT